MKGQDQANIPFVVQSTVSFDALRMQVAEKLRCFPGLLQLRYNLDSDKPKDPPTSIQTEEELKLFIAQTRSLIVPQRLAKGKLSTRQLRKVIVRFKDGSTDNVTHDVPAGLNKKVCALALMIILLFTLFLE